MVEDTVYRDVLGENLSCYHYDLEIEIACTKRRWTRSCATAVEEGRYFYVILIFSHYRTPEVKYLRLTNNMLEDLEKAVIKHKTTPSDGDHPPIDGFDFWCHKDHDILALYHDRHDYETALIPGGLDRILYACKVKRYLDSTLRMVQARNDESHTPLKRLEWTCGKMVLKNAVANAKGLSLTDPVSMREYEGIVKLFFSLKQPARKAVWRDTSTLLAKAVDAFQLPHATIAVPEFRDAPRIEKAYNELCEPLEQWDSECLFVRGIWNQCFS